MTRRPLLLLPILLGLAVPAAAATDPLEDGVRPAQAAPQPPSTLGPAPLPAPMPQGPMSLPPREPPASAAPPRPAPAPSRCTPPPAPTS